MDLADENAERRQPPRLNYFNFFTEVEEEFVRRRGTHLLISPIDWALVETWKNAGIPLHVVLNGINKAFDHYDARAVRFRKVNHLLYCQQAIEETYAEWSASQIGGPSTDGGAELLATSSGKRYPTTVTSEEVVEYIDRLDADLRAINTAAAGADVAHRADSIEKVTEDDVEAPTTNSLFLEAVGRSRARLSEIRASILASDHADAEAVERDFDSIDRLLMLEVKTLAGEKQLARLRKEAKKELRGYRNKMAKELYDQTIENFIARRLREQYRIPRLSLFFM